MKKKYLIKLFLPIVLLIITVASIFTYTISAGTNSALPTHVLTGYWQNFNNGAKCLRISDVPTSYNIIAVAFADATGAPGTVDFKLDSGLSTALGGYTEEQFISDVKTVKARGQKVIISVGGQNGTISVADAVSAKNFAESINKLMDKFGFDDVDIDLENGINDTYMADALRAVKSGSVITMAPQTIDMQSPNAGYFKLALKIKDILTICNMQYYNSGSMLGFDGKVYSQGGEDFLTALAAIQLENGLRADQVGLGLPASTSGAGSGYVSPTVVGNALDCLATGKQTGTFKPTKLYPTIRGAMTWSINWDASNNYNFANAVSAKLSSLPGGTEPTKKPEPTNIPETIKTPEIKITPSATNTPEITIVPSDAPTPEMTAIPEVTLLPSATITPDVVVTPSPTIKPKPKHTCKPKETNTPKVEPTPKPTSTVNPENTEVVPTVSPEIKPIETPKVLPNDEKENLDMLRKIASLLEKLVKWLNL